MKLSEIQDAFQDHMIRKVSDIDPAFAKLYQTGNIPLNERLRVYRDNVIGGLAVTLSESFPTVMALTGDEFAHGLMREYIRRNLPTSGSLQDYGDDLPDFIETFEAARGVPYLSDIARFDWVMDACEHAKDDVALRAEDLQNLMNAEDVHLLLRTSAYLLSSEYALTDIRNFALDPENHQKEAPAIKQSDNTYILIYRPYLKAEYLTLSKEEYDFFRLLEDKNPLNAALEQQLQTHQAFDFQSFLQKFISLETFRT